MNVSGKILKTELRGTVAEPRGVTHDGPLRMTMQTGDSVGDRVTDDSFRAEVRRWLAGVDLWPDVLPMRPSGWAVSATTRAHIGTRARAWQCVLHHAGWAGISWPAAYGGRGGTPLQELILREELEDVGATRVPFFTWGRRWWARR